MRRNKPRLSEPPIERIGAGQSIPLSESIRGSPVRLHNLPNLRPDCTPDRNVLNSVWRIGRMVAENFPTMSDYVSTLMGEFEYARSCKVYVSPKNTFTERKSTLLEHRLTVNRYGQQFVADETPADVKTGDDHILGPLIDKAFTRKQVIMLDSDVGVRIDANLDMDSDSCDVYPMDRVRGENSIAVMPFYYRDTEHPSGVVVFEGDLRCMDSKLEGFAKSFWAMKTAMAATAQIAFQLTHKFDAITILTKTADFYVDFKSGIADLLWNGTKSLYLVLIDVDDFKKVNDNYGYQRGNDVLRLIAGTIKASVRSGDMVSRWGGEEFAVILKDVSKEEAEVIAERIRANVERSNVRSKNGDIKVTCSIGVTDVSPIADYILRAGQTDDTISSISDVAFDTSDQSLKYAKRHGKNQVHFAQAESLNILQ